jgi:Domain of unknown function (DUF6249)
MMRFAWVFMIPIVAIIGGCTVAIAGMMARARVREAEIRERIAMIERGLVPAPEVDPRGFDQAMNRIDHRSVVRNRDASGKHRRAGILMMGIGFGLMLLISVAGGAPAEGIGVGGFLVIFGVALLLLSWMNEPVQQPSTWPPASPPPPPPAPPPSPPDLR